MSAEDLKSSVVGYLVATTAHKLRNPLAAASSQLQLMMMKLPENDPSKEPLQTIATQLDRIEAAIYDLVHFVSCERTKGGTVDLIELLKETGVKVLSHEKSCLVPFGRSELKLVLETVVKTLDGAPTATLRLGEERLCQIGCEGATPSARLDFDTVSEPGVAFGLSLCQTIVRESGGRLICEVDKEKRPFFTLVISKENL